MTNEAAAQKSAEAFRTISEVAEHLKLPQHVLRFWETRFVQIKPLKRAGGRRFYRPEDVELLGAIRQLLYGEGYTIKGVQRMLREQGARSVASLTLRRDGPADAPGGDAPGTELVEEEVLRDAPVAMIAVNGEDLAAMLDDALDELAACRGLLAGNE